MRRVATTLGLGLLLACQSASESDYPEQYRAWCWSESKPLGDWRFARSVPEEQKKRHDRMFPHHNVTVKVWRGDPAKTGAR